MLHAGFRLVLGDLHFYLQSHSSNKAYLLVFFFFGVGGGGGGGVVCIKNFYSNPRKAPIH
jgi:hypothetical protein